MIFMIAQKEEREASSNRLYVRENNKIWDINKHQCFLCVPNVGEIISNVVQDSIYMDDNKDVECFKLKEKKSKMLISARPSSLIREKNLITQPKTTEIENQFKFNAK